MKSQLRALIEQGLCALRTAGTLPADLASPDFSVERPKERAHGDFSTNAAMLLAKAARTNPRALAQQVLAKNMLKRLGEPQDIAHCALWLASDEARYVTGADIAVDAGATAW
mgnify:CR=1 FL=1